MGIYFMRILVVHNSYQLKGGEDAVVENEVELLQSNGHEVYLLKICNDQIQGLKRKLNTAIGSIFSFSGYMRMSRSIDSMQPDIVHVHNYFPLLSPSVFFACKRKRVPVVHTLHNYRAICPTAFLMHRGEVVEHSIKGGPWWALRERVYKKSLLGTFFLVSMIAFNRKIGTWKNCVDVFIALTDFSKKKFVEAGWPEDLILVKPNFVKKVEVTEVKRAPYALFVGRLSEEKGIPFLIEAFKSSGDLELRVVGQGPLESLVEKSSGENIRYLGRLSGSSVAEQMAEASCLVMASTWYEGFPMVIVEAMSSGLPIVVPKLGSMSVIVPHKKAGLHYVPGNQESLISSVAKILKDKEIFDLLSTGAYKEYQEKYTPEHNLKMLEDIYTSAISAGDV